MRWGALAVLLMTACNPVYSPPVRGLHSGMPGLLSDRQLEVGATIGGLVYPSVLVPHLALGLRDGFSFELGANFNVGSQNWAMGWSGARLTLDKHLGVGRKLYGDFELGAGFGAGGSDGPPRTMTAWNLLRAYGMYGGVGVGVRTGYFGVYGRARMDASDGERTGTTLWPSAILGVEMRIAHHLVLGLAGGYLGVFSPGFTLHGWLYQGQLRYFFDVPI